MAKRQERMRSCAICKKLELLFRAGHPVLFKYGPRSYAHAACGMEKHGGAFLAKLSRNELAQFPALVAAKFGALAELERLIGGIP